MERITHTEKQQEVQLVLRCREDRELPPSAPSDIAASLHATFLQPRVQVNTTGFCGLALALSQPFTELYGHLQDMKIFSSLSDVLHAGTWDAGGALSFRFLPFRPNTIPFADILLITSYLPNERLKDDDDAEGGRPSSIVAQSRKKSLQYTIMASDASELTSDIWFLISHNDAD
ncbi:hypothetical protein PAMP_013927 [Pampus punctatissimus]